MCTFMKKKRKWNTKCTTGTAMCIHEIQQLLLSDLGPAFSHWVSSQQSKAQQNSKQSLWKKRTKDWIRLEISETWDFWDQDSTFNSWKRKNFWNQDLRLCLVQTPGRTKALFNFRLKPWSRWGHVHRFNEQCRVKSRPWKQAKKKTMIANVFSKVFLASILAFLANICWNFPGCGERRVSRWLGDWLPKQEENLITASRH